jgi:hypothetical protein
MKKGKVSVWLLALLVTVFTIIFAWLCGGGCNTAIGTCQGLAKDLNAISNQPQQEK